MYALNGVSPYKHGRSRWEVSYRWLAGKQLQVDQAGG